MKRDELVRKDFHKILCNFWIMRILYSSESADHSVLSTGEAMSNSSPEQNKAIVLEAFETLFNKRDYVAAERFWSPNYIQQSAHIPPGRQGLFDLVRSVPETLHYENQFIIAEGDYVIAHGRFTGMGRPAAWIAADVIRFEDGLLREHWDVLQDEATKAESVSGLPMFGNTFPK
jgi:predicted SnoaL-like aldol condensation-catalyzing enzyme